jgi:hypothetical protein
MVNVVFKERLAAITYGRNESDMEPFIRTQDHCLEIYCYKNKQSVDWDAELIAAFPRENVLSVKVLA